MQAIRLSTGLPDSFISQVKGECLRYISSASSSRRPAFLKEHAIFFALIWAASVRSRAPRVSLGPFPRVRAPFAPQLFFSLSAWFSAIATMESDSSEELVRALSLCRVPEALATQIAQAYETPSDFAFAFPQLPDLNRLLEDIDEDTKRAIGLEPDAPILASLPASRLRKALKMCQDATMHGGAGRQPQLTPTPVRSIDSLTHSHVWVENLPPKLTTETVDSLVSTFKQNYPGELLDNDSMPSIRLLSLVHEGLKTRLKWIPWQYRLSQKQYQEILEAKTTKAVRSEVQLLTAAFMDDQPELSAESRPLSAGWLMQIQTIFRNALALCNAAHLKSLKDFDKKMADLCLKQPDRTSGLRTVTTQELLSAGRRVWNTR